MPDFVPLEQLYTRALKLLGVQSPGARQTALSLAVQPVSIISDVADASVPHSNPVFATTRTVAAVVAEFSTFELLAINRLVRVRQYHVTDATAPRFWVQEATAITTLTDSIAGTSMGPAVDVGLAAVRRGPAVATVAPVGSYRPEQDESVDFRPPLLLAPGFRFCMSDNVANTTPIYSLIWEEIPLQLDIANLGFPL